MNPSGPAPERSTLVHLVDALTQGQDPPAVLVHLAPDRAALALMPSAVLLVVLDARPGEPWDAVAERAANVLRGSRPEVVQSLSPSLMAVVLLGGVLGPPDLAAAPTYFPALERAVHWLAARPDGTVIADTRDLPRVPRVFLDRIDTVVREGIERSVQSAGGAARLLVERFGPPTVANETRFREALGARLAPYTTGLLVACGAVFLAEEYFGAGRSMDMMLRMGALSTRSIAEGHYEALLSYAMLHGGLLHIVMNGWALNAVGTLLENVIGGRRMLFVFTLSALGGGVAVVLGGSGVPVVGASAGIFGLITALLGLALRSTDLPPLARTRIKRGVLLTLLLNLFISLLPEVSLLGHAGGAIVGLILGASGVLTAGVNLPWRAPQDAALHKRMDLLFRFLGAACIAALALSLGLAWLRGRPWAG